MTCTGGVPAGEGSSSALTEDLAHNPDMKNPGQDGYQPAQASLARPFRGPSPRARVPLRVISRVSNPAAPSRRPALPRQPLLQTRMFHPAAAGPVCPRLFAGC